MQSFTSGLGGLTQNLPNLGGLTQNFPRFLSKRDLHETEVQSKTDFFREITFSTRFDESSAMDPFLVLALLSLQWKLFYLGFPPRGNRGKREISSNESNFTKKIQKVLISRNYFPSFLGTTNYTTLCPFGQELNEEFCVKLITKKLKWQEAQNYCQTTFGPK